MYVEKLRSETKRTRRTATALAFVLALALLSIGSLDPVFAESLPTRCDGGGDYGSTLEQDTTWSGDVYLGQSLIVRKNATTDSYSTLTIQAGTKVFFCGDYSMSIGGLFSPGRLVVEGTEENPVIFDAAPGAPGWGSISFVDTGDEPSQMMYAILRNGGGQDPNADTASVEISSRASFLGSEDYLGPILDHVTIEDSTTYGMIVDMTSNQDPTPPSLTNLTINGSGNAPMRLMAAAVGGLGSGNSFADNNPDRIQVGENDGSSGISTDSIYFDVRWRNQPAPYELLNNVITRNGYPDKSYSIWTIDPGVKVLVHPMRRIEVGSNDTAQLLAIGTESEPIIFDRLDSGSGNWRNIAFNPYSKVGSEMTYVQVLHGGGEAADREAAIEKGSRAPLILNHVTVENSTSVGLTTSNDAVNINNSVFRNNDIGIETRGGMATIRNTVFENNATAALVNTSNSICIDAAGNYWGGVSGPLDTDTDSKGCNNAGQTNAGDGGVVSDGVLYHPWLPSSDTSVVSDRSSISSGSKLWVVANGVDSANLTITVRDGDGNPIQGVLVELATTLGDLVQPSQPTNADGATTASITSTETGDAYITARNTTDDVELATSLTLVFWQDDRQTGGLIDPSGTPYLSPELVIENEPVQVGFPLVFRVPMRNSQQNALDVNVEYSISNFGVGNRWTPVSDASMTLQPDESYDFPGGFNPPDSVHRCVQYTVDREDATGQAVQSAFNGVFGGSKNIKNAKPPCNNLNATKLIPTGIGVSGARKHFKNAADQTNKVRNCLDENVTYQVQAGSASSERDYTQLVTPQAFTPPVLEAGGGVTQAQADAANAASQAGADVASLNLALVQTQELIYQASQAQAWNHANSQLEQYRVLQRARAQALTDLGSAIDDYLAVMDDDPVYTAQDFAEYLADLKANGFGAETLAFHRATGLSDAEIDQMLARTIEAMEGTAYVTTRFSGILMDLRDLVLNEASGVYALYPDRPLGGVVGGAGIQASAASQNLYPLGVLEEEFPVTNPRDQIATINLVVRRGNMPVNWTANLSQTALELEAGESAMVQLQIDPGDAEVMVDEEIYASVEGYIGNEFIGGAMFHHLLPVDFAVGKLYLPAIQNE